MALQFDLDIESQVELDRVRERNRIAKRKSRARQRQMQGVVEESHTVDGSSANYDSKVSINVPIPEHSDLPGQDTTQSSRPTSESGNPSRNTERDTSNGRSVFGTPEIGINESKAAMQASTTSHVETWNTGRPPSQPVLTLQEFLSGDQQLDAAGSTPFPMSTNQFGPAACESNSLNVLPSSADGLYFHLESENSSADSPIAALADLWYNSHSVQVVNPMTLSTDNSSSSSMLHLTVRNGSTAIARTLLVAGANVHSVDKGGSLPLHLAVQHRRRSIAELLIDHGADINAVNSAGMTPLELAVRGQDENMVKRLIERGARVA